MAFPADGRASRGLCPRNATCASWTGALWLKTYMFATLQTMYQLGQRPFRFKTCVCECQERGFREMTRTSVCLFVPGDASHLQIHATAWDISIWFCEFFIMFNVARSGALSHMRCHLLCRQYSREHSTPACAVKVGERYMRPQKRTGGIMIAMHL